MQFMRQEQLMRHDGNSHPRAVLRVVAGVALAGWLAGCSESQPSVPKPLILDVAVSKPLLRTIPEYVDTTGKTDAVQSVDIRSRVTGYLEKVAFEEGAEVNKGDLLFEIDRRPFQAEFDKNLAQEVKAKATLKLRKAELERAKLLFGKQAIPRADFDHAVAAYDDAEASVQAAHAATEGAKHNLDYATIRSPIDGQIGRSSITVGNLVAADNTVLTNVVSVDPVYAYFDIDENTLQKIEQRIREGKISQSGKNEIPVLLGLDTEQGYPHPGNIDFADNRVDPNTGTIRLRGVFANPKPPRGSRILKPGLFARIRIPIGDPRPLLWVPERAIGTDLDRKIVCVVGPDNKAEFRCVTLGQLEDGLRAIENGLGPDDQVILRRIQRVRPGMTVNPQLEEIRPDADKTTSPAGQARRGRPTKFHPAVKLIEAQCATQGRRRSLAASALPGGAWEQA